MLREALGVVAVEEQDAKFSIITCLGFAKLDRFSSLQYLLPQKFLFNIILHLPLLQISISCETTLNCWMDVGLGENNMARGSLSCQLQTMLWVIDICARSIMLIL